MSQVQEQDICEKEKQRQMDAAWEQYERGRKRDSGKGPVGSQRGGSFEPASKSEIRKMQRDRR